MAEMKTGQKADPPLVLRRHDSVRDQGYGSDINPKVRPSALFCCTLRVPGRFVARKFARLCASTSLNERPDVEEGTR